MRHVCRAAGYSRRGFTLIELLVVVSIIGLLMGILLPTLRSARSQARRTQCLTNLRSLFLGQSQYLDAEGRFPALNNDKDEGAWQYNYLIWDGRDFENGFGPVARPGGEVGQIELLFCPVQQDPFHRLGTLQNPWPALVNLDVRAGYGRRHGLSGKSLSQLRRLYGYAADLHHLPKYITESGHKTGVNTVYTDGHARWVDAPDVMIENELTSPFDPADNGIIEDIWDELDRKGQ